MSDLINALESLAAKRATRKEARDFYEGTASEVFVSEAVRKAIGGDTSKFKINFSRIPVTARLSRMKISNVTTADESVNALLDAIARENEFDLESEDVHEATLVEGETYAIVWQSSDESGTVDIFHNDGESVDLFYDPENPRVKSHAVKAWVATDGHLRVNLYYADRIERWVSKDDKPAENGKHEDKDFEPFIEDGESWPTPNPYGKVPVFHFKTGRKPRPVHLDAFGPQRLIDKLTISHASTIDYQSMPQRYLLEHPDKAADLPSFDSDFMVDDDDDDAKQDPKLAAGPGGVWWLRGVGGAGQFDAASPEVFTAPAQQYVDHMATVTSTPLHSFHLGAMPSGQSLRVAEAPLVGHVKNLERHIGGTWEDVFEFALEILGVTAEVQIAWAPAATYDDVDAWDVVKAKVEAGLSLNQALREHGYTQDQIDEFVTTLPVQPVVVDE